MDTQNERPLKNATVEFFKFVDLLANVADELGGKAISAQLHDMLAQPTEEKCSRLAEFFRRADACAQSFAKQLATQTSAVRSRLNQHTKECERITLKLTQKQADLQVNAEEETIASEAELRRKLQPMLKLAAKESRKVMRLEDYALELQWCCHGMEQSAQAALANRDFRATPYPIRPFTMQRPFQNWVVSLQPLVEQLAAIFPEKARRLNAVLERLQSNTATITFGGRFKSGKSSLLNAALGQERLPTYDLPMTGASCYISAGERDSAELICQGERRPIPCNVDELRKAISLQGGAEGTQRVANVNRLNLRFVDFPGGPNVTWIDPPGLFDQPEMTSRAWQAAHDADVIVWVFKSQQFLGEAEAEAIAQFIMQRGPGSIVFVENAWLPKGETDPWQYHLREIAPVDLGKLEQFANSLELSPDQMPPLVVVSAIKMLEQGYGFGAATLRRLLGKIGGPNCVLIRRARLQWAEIELREVTEFLRDQWRLLSEQNGKLRAAADLKAARHRKARERFQFEVHEQVSVFLSQFDVAATQAGEDVAALVNADIHRDNTYADELCQRMNQSIAELGATLLHNVSRAAAKHGQYPLTHRAMSELRLLLEFQLVNVAVPDNPVSTLAVGAGAGVGAAMGSLFFGIGAVPGALIGMAVTGFGAGVSATSKDREKTKQIINEAADQSAIDLRLKHAAIVNLLLDQCPQPPGTQPVGNDNDQRLLRLYQQVDAAARNCAKWIRREAEL